MSIALRAIEVLTIICYAMDPLYRPGRYLRADGSLWMHEHGLERRLGDLRRNGLVERRKDASGWVYFLTDRGRRFLSGNHDPEARWRRPWDGHWRQIIFDLPSRQRTLRAGLLRWLKANHFGYLQDSLWITPDPVSLSLPALGKMGASADMVVFLESRTIGASSNAAMVKAAWNFERIFAAHEDYQTFVRMNLLRKRRALLPAEAVGILRQEHNLWQRTMALDPLLPKALWPVGYPGGETLASRRCFFEGMRKQITRSACKR